MLEFRVIKTYEVTVDRPKSEILKTIESEKNKWIDFFSNPPVDFKEFSVTEGQILIKRRPTFKSALRPRGNITIDIKEITEKKSCLLCKILILKYTALIQSIVIVPFLCLWSLISIIVAGISTGIIMIITGWCLFGLVIYLSYQINKFRLIEYSKTVVKELGKHSKPLLY